MSYSVKSPSYRVILLIKLMITEKVWNSKWAEHMLEQIKTASSSTPQIFDHQKDETSTSSGAGDNETEQGDNVSVEVDANINELRQPSADQPVISGLASASSPTLHAVDIPAYTSTDPGTWGEINDENAIA
ncbi:unnamed protein product [Leuciscus chuanchicus]